MTRAVVVEGGWVHATELARLPGRAAQEPVEVELLAADIQPTDRQTALGQVRVPLLPGLDVLVAAAATGALVDAMHALHDLAGTEPGDTVLVLGFSTGVGAAAVASTLAAGHRAFAATRDVATVSARDGPTVLGNDGLPTQVRTATDGRGVDVVIDTVGGAYTAVGLHSGRRGGRQVLLGYQAAPSSVCWCVTSWPPACRWWA